MSSSTIRSHHVAERGRSSALRNSTRCRPAQTQQSPSTPRVYKYIWGGAGVVGTITDPSGVTLIDLTEVENIVGGMRARYLDVHGYGMEVLQIIMNAYQSASTMEEFVSEAHGCGMTIVELEWFWELS